jgi:hypothetical protein
MTTLSAAVTFLLLSRYTGKLVGTVTLMISAARAVTLSKSTTGMVTKRDRRTLKSCLIRMGETPLEEWSKMDKRAEPTGPALAG